MFRGHAPTVGVPSGPELRLFAVILPSPDSGVRRPCPNRSRTQRPHRKYRAPPHPIHTPGPRLRKRSAGLGVGRQPHLFGSRRLQRRGWILTEMRQVQPQPRHMYQKLRLTAGPPHRRVLVRTPGPDPAPPPRRQRRNAFPDKPQVPVTYTSQPDSNHTHRNRHTYLPVHPRSTDPPLGRRPYNTRNNSPADLAITVHYAFPIVPGANGVTHLGTTVEHRVCRRRRYRRPAPPDVSSVSAACKLPPLITPVVSPMSRVSSSGSQAARVNSKLRPRRLGQR